MIVLVLLLAVDAPPAERAPALEMPRALVDDAGVLDDETAGALEEELEAHRAQSGVAVGVLTLPELGGGTLVDAMDRASRAFRSGWAAGSPHVLVVLAVHERRMRVEVDDALQDMVGDRGLADLTSDATQRFAAGDLQAGLVGLTRGLIARTPRAPMTRTAAVTLTVAVAGGVIALALLAGLLMRLRRRKPA